MIEGQKAEEEVQDGGVAAGVMIDGQRMRLAEDPVDHEPLAQREMTQVGPFKHGPQFEFSFP